MVINRRSALKGVSLSALITAPALSSHASATAAEPLVPLLPGAAARWFFDLTSEVAAILIADAVQKTFISAWKDWQRPTERAIQYQADGGYPWHKESIYGHWLPGTSFVSVSREQQSNPATDRLVLVLEDGSSIYLSSWAWRSVDAFIKQATEDKTGDDLLHVSQLLAKTVLPRDKFTQGGSPRNTTVWVAYSARDGDVEIVYSWTPKIAQIVMTATGFFAGSPGNPTVKAFKYD
jgi:hypothetical protein